MPTVATMMKVYAISGLLAAGTGILFLSDSGGASIGMTQVFLRISIAVVVVVVVVVGTLPPVVRRGTGLHVDHTGSEPGKEAAHLRAAEPRLEERPTRVLDAVNLEGLLGEIETYSANGLRLGLGWDAASHSTTGPLGAGPSNPIDLRHVARLPDGPAPDNVPLPDGSIVAEPDCACSLRLTTEQLLDLIVKAANWRAAIFSCVDGTGAPGRKAAARILADRRGERDVR